ncbi:hypothetical protein ABIF93_009394 [Bradyrhizobium japonicum]
MPRSSRGMTAENAATLPKPRATVSLCDAFPVGLKLRNDSRTNRGRIADSRRSLFRSRHMSRDSYWLCTRWSFALPHKRRFDDRFLKIGDGAESNQNRGSQMDSRITTPKLIFAKTTPCTVGMPLKGLHFFPAKLPPRHPEVRVARCAASRREPRRMDGPDVAGMHGYSLREQPGCRPSRAAEEAATSG